MHIRSGLVLTCLAFAFSAAGSAAAGTAVQFFDPHGNLIVGAPVDVVIFDAQGQAVRSTLPPDPDGTYDVPVAPGQKVTFVPAPGGSPALANARVSLIVPDAPATVPLPVIVPLGGPANDECSSAEFLTLPASVSATTVGATDTDAPLCGTSDDTAGDVWYEFQGTGTQVVVSLCAADGGAADYDSKLSVYCTDCFTCMGGNDDSCGLQSRVVVHTTFDRYRIQVHGFGADTGSFTLAVVDTGLPAPNAIMCFDPPPQGACCKCIPHAPDNCTLEDESRCAELGGVFQGNGSECLTATGVLHEFHASPNTPIPTNVPAGISHTIHVPVHSFIVDVNVNIGITHTWQSDLMVQVEHDGISQELWSRTNGCTSGDNIQATADDSGTATSCATIGSGPIHGVFYAPAVGGQGPLSVFNGQDAFGPWTLTVIDLFASDVGTLNFWGVDIRGGLPVCAVCGDGVVDAGESCDDGNAVPFDGCTQCQSDPRCPAGGPIGAGERCAPPVLPRTDIRQIGRETPPG